MSKAEALARANLLGVGIHVVNMDRVLSLVGDALSGDRKHYICATGMHGIMEAQKDAHLKAILNGSFLNIPDGKPTVWVGRIQHFGEMDHVGGPEMMLEICRLSSRTDYTHFLYGGKPGVADALSTTLRHRFPSIKIVGTYTPPFRRLNSDEEAELIRMVAQSAPDIFWVGISTPKQEKFMAEYLSKLDTKLMFGVGAAFDFHTGRVKLAPNWMKRSGLAWLFRLCHEPRRLWRRYLFNIPRFMCAMSLQLLGWTTYTLENPAVGDRESARPTMSDIPDINK